MIWSDSPNICDLSFPLLKLQSPFCVKFAHFTLTDNKKLHAQSDKRYLYYVEKRLSATFWSESQFRARFSETGFLTGFPVLGGDFGRILGEIWDLHLHFRRPRTTSGGQISVRCSPNTFLPSAKIRFPIPPLGKFPGRFPQKSHFYNGMPIPRLFLY